MNVAVLLAVTILSGCESENSRKIPDVPASADPQGRELVKGAIIVATEKSGGVRTYKLTGIQHFPAPMGDELIMIAYQQKGATFKDAAELWAEGQLTIAISKVRVYKNVFMTRDYRVIAQEPVAAWELEAKRDDPQRRRGKPGKKGKSGKRGQ